jgi:hypothetical protein
MNLKMCARMCPKMAKKASWYKGTKLQNNITHSSATTGLAHYSIGKN